MSSSSRSPKTRLLVLAALALTLAVPAVSAKDVAVHVERVRAEGRPTGDPEIDEKVAKLPALPSICRMFAKCTHVGASDHHVKWKDPVVVGKGRDRLEVTVDRPNSDGATPVTVAIGEADERCMPASTSAVAPGSPLVRFCEQRGDSGTTIFVITVRPN